LFHFPTMLKINSRPYTQRYVNNSLLYLLMHIIFILFYYINAPTF